MDMCKKRKKDTNVLIGWVFEMVVRRVRNLIRLGNIVRNGAQIRFSLQ